jgi:histone acetyltransferase MYST1
MDAQFELNALVSCPCEEFGCEMPARILKFRDSGTEAYVHFRNQDKRLDRWMSVTDMKPYVPDGSQPDEDPASSHGHDESTDDESMSAEARQFEQLHREVTKVRNIELITIGKSVIRAWYYSPYPPPYHDLSHLYLCEHCFKYFGRPEDLAAHAEEEGEVHPQGREVYRKGTISIFELHGTRQKISCQCLCLLAKLFLDHKTLFYDVEGFLFYVLCECDEKGAHAAAYFSREITSDENNILACITVLPPFQKCGYGRMLISLSYEIAKRQRTSGGPERPLSDLGKLAFHSYWRDTVVGLLSTREKEIDSIEDLEKLTAMQRSDIVEILKEINCVVKIKGEYELEINKESLSNTVAQLATRGKRAVIDPQCLIWLPEIDDA